MKTKIVIDGVELMVEQIDDAVTIMKVIGRDRVAKKDIRNGVGFTFHGDAVLLIKKLKQAAALPTSRCTCDYGRGWSDHAEHCRSIYKASYEDHLYD